MRIFVDFPDIISKKSSIYLQTHRSFLKCMYTQHFLLASLFGGVYALLRIHSAVSK